MSRSLYTGASGLLAHQRKLDVVSNNLANLNTIGYKTQRLNFADLLYQTVNTATGTTDPRFAGTNPSEVGNGVSVSQTQRRLDQGVLQATGEMFDFAIVGGGYFTTTDGVQNFFTRDGSFTVNSNGYLTAATTGFLVSRTGSLGEPTDGLTGFQVPGDMGIRIPLGATIPGRLTGMANFTGNLPLSAEPPQVEIHMSANPYLTGGVAAVGTTLLNDLDSNSVDYISGDQLRISGSGFDGTAFSIDLPVDTTTTLDDLVTAINTDLNGATAELDANGNIVVTADTTGETQMEIRINEVTGNTGATRWIDHDLLTEVKGTDGDEVNSTIQIFDERGAAQNMAVTFRKVGVNTWDATFQLTAENGTMVDNVVRGIEFNDDGTFRRVNGTDEGDSRITLNLDGITEDQTIRLDFSEMSHTPANFGTFFDQDGFPIGLLASVSVGSSGVLEGIATNGVRIPIAQLNVANFRNEQGLSASGNNNYRETIASGEAQFGQGLTGNRGQVVGGNLEQSNVDMAFEFTQLIIAQRGFSANARTITITDNMLEELTNIVR